MTDTDLIALVDRRAAAWHALGRFSEALADLTPADRARVDRASAEFRGLDRAIVAELRVRGQPVVVGERRLVLTRDRLSFVETDRAGEVPGLEPYDPKGVKTGLWDYGRAGAR